MLAQTITTMFASFVLFVAGIIAITEAVNKIFKVENHRVKLFISWGLSFGLAALGLALQLGFFADCGPVDAWQSWAKALLIGFGAALAANKIYDREEIWDILEWIFSFFNKNGKEIRARLDEKHKK